MAERLHTHKPRYGVRPRAMEEIDREGPYQSLARSKRPSPIVLDEAAGTARVDVGRGFDAVIDIDDVDLVRGYRWRVLITVHGHAYARCWTADGGVLMHRLLLGAEAGQSVDHEDGDGLNNRQANIRLCTQRQNAANKAVERRSRLGLKGVYRTESGKRFRASIKPDGKTIHLGTYGTPEEAAAAYRGAAIVLWGEFAKK